jgi:uncharacterized surface protein with fasciclin (FAS1) repeats
LKLLSFFALNLKIKAMKTTMKSILFMAVLGLFACNSRSGDYMKDDSGQSAGNETSLTGQSGVQDDVSSPNIVQVASGSKDHTTLVTAVKAGELVDALSNAGPFTVFAPTNAAFNKLPAGTVDGLLKADKKETLVDILQYHVSVGVYKGESLMDGQSLGQVNGGNINITMVDGKPLINGKAHILASIVASNGIIHVIDEVLLPSK